MDILKRFGAMCKSPWMKENAGDLLILSGILMIPCVTFFLSVVMGFYALSVALIIVGILYIKGRGGE